MSENEAPEQTPEEEVSPQKSAGSPVGLVQPPAAEGEAGGVEAGSGRKCCACAWGKLILVALVAALLGAIVTANWHTMRFSVFFAVINVKAGAVFLATAALGFILGAVFIWSALVRE